MASFFERICPDAQGTICFLYHDDSNAPVPAYTDPIELLGDINRLSLTPEQTSELRTLLCDEIAANGPEGIWRNRAFRKNLIHSFGLL